MLHTPCHMPTICSTNGGGITPVHDTLCGQHIWQKTATPPSPEGVTKSPDRRAPFSPLFRPPPPPPPRGFGGLIRPPPPFAVQFSTRPRHRTVGRQHSARGKYLHRNYLHKAKPLRRHRNARDIACAASPYKLRCTPRPLRERPFLRQEGHCTDLASRFRGSADLTDIRRDAPGSGQLVRASAFLGGHSADRGLRGQPPGGRHLPLRDLQRGT